MSDNRSRVAEDHIPVPVGKQLAIGCLFLLVLLLLLGVYFIYVLQRNCESGAICPSYSDPNEEPVVAGVEANEEPVVASVEVSAFNDNPDPVVVGGTTIITATVASRQPITVELWVRSGSAWLPWGEMKPEGGNEYRIEYGPLDTAGMHPWRIIVLTANGFTTPAWVSAVCGTDFGPGRTEACPGGVTTVRIDGAD